MKILIVSAWENNESMYPHLRTVLDLLNENGIQAEYYKFFERGYSFASSLSCAKAFKLWKRVIKHLWLLKRFCDKNKFDKILVIDHFTYVCANFIFDLNGNKGPNTVGKDIGFLTVFYPIDSKVVAPIPHQRDAGTNIAQEDASAACTAQDPEYRIPNMYEMASLFTNKDLIGNITSSVGYNTSSVLSSTQAWRVGTQSGNFWVGEKSLARYLRCVKRN